MTIFVVFYNDAIYGAFKTKIEADSAAKRLQGTFPALRVTVKTFSEGM